MPAPASYFYSSVALIAAHTALLAEIDGGAGPGKIRLYTDADVLLCDIAFTDPAGTLDAGGVLTLTPAGPGSAVATGTCTYGTIVDSDNVVLGTFPASTGTVAVPGEIVINSLAIVSGAAVTVNSAVIG